jgi:predicted nucleotidyltransferase
MTMTVSQLSSLSHEEARALNLLLESMQRRFGDRLSDIVLFGSKARAESTADSDIDVLVILESPSAIELRDAGGFGFDVWAESGIFLALQVVESEYWDSAACRESLFFRNVARDGVSLLPQAA